MPPKNRHDRSEYDRRYYNQKKKHPTRGDTKKIFFPIRLPESLVAQAQIMAAQATTLGKYPGTWRTPTGVFRGLIMKGLEKLKEEGDQSVAENLAALELEQHLHGIGRARRQAVTAMTQARQEIESLIDIGSEDEAVQYYVATLEAASKMARTVWTEWLVKEMRKAFPDLHKRYVKGDVPGMKMQTARKRTTKRRR